MTERLDLKPGRPVLRANAVNNQESFAMHALPPTSVLRVPRHVDATQVIRAKVRAHVSTAPHASSRGVGNWDDLRRDRGPRLKYCSRGKPSRHGRRAQLRLRAPVQQEPLVLGFEPGDSSLVHVVPRLRSVEDADQIFVVVAVRIAFRVTL